MDNLYDNLENYEDENIVSELKQENGELKFKLEEYANSMAKLQKDFDNLSSEFKKLEMNYSSLLKTAREEIERKTQIINQLNQDKDMMVLNAIQNKNKPIYRRNIGMYKPLGRDLSNDRSKVKSIEAEPDKLKHNEIARKGESRFSSTDTATSTEQSDNNAKFPKNYKHSTQEENLRSNQKNETKENNSQAHALLKDSDRSDVKASSIKNRRKSMPAIRSDVKFSSDEEGVGNNSFNDPKRTLHSRNNISRGPLDNIYKDQYRMQGIDEKYRTSCHEDKFSGYHETNKDYTYHRSGNNNYFGTDKYRNRDKYDNSQKYRRNYSPERLRRSTRNYQDELFSRQDYTRLRVLESPPLDKFYNYQRRNREARSKYERDDPYEYERNYDRHQDKYTFKPKLHSDFEEPSAKRQRTNSNSRHQEEETHWRSERCHMQNPSAAVVESIQQEHTSCQSPDYIIPEASAQPVKEIRNTAATQLEDPRKSSKKYIFQTVDDRTVLTSVAGRDVDLKMVDTTDWNLPRVEVPKALTRRPSQCSDIVDQVYGDIENPVSNMSTGSGEIVEDENKQPVAPPHLKHTEKPEIESVPKKHSQMAEYENKSQKPSTTNLVKNIESSSYKIPKIKDTQKHKKTDNKAKVPCTLEVTNKNLDNIKEKTDNTQAVKKNSNDLIHALKLKFNDNAFTKKEIVQGDLELSDETSDNIDLLSKAFDDKTSEKSQNNTNTSALSSERTKEMSKGKNHTSLREKENGARKATSQLQNIEVDSKKHKSKKRSHKSSSSELPKEENNQIVDRISKPKKDKKDPKEIKAKITELFGDSSSLITPEDLGLSACQALKQPSAIQYLPICEDAQDAIDVNVSDSCTIQTRLSKLKTNDTNNLAGNTLVEDQTDIKVNSKSRRKKLKRNELSVVLDAKNDSSINENEPKQSRTTEVHQNVEKEHSAPKFLPELNTILTSSEKQIDKTKLNDHKDKTLNEKLKADTPFNELPDLTDTITKTVTDKPVKAMNKLKTDVLIKALATSTPHKEMKQPGHIPYDGGMLPPSDAGMLPSSDAGKLPSSDAGMLPPSDAGMRPPSDAGIIPPSDASVVPPSDKTVPNFDSNNVTDQSSNNDTLDSQTDADAPDVRIFVKRRRKVKLVKR